MSGRLGPHCYISTIRWISVKFHDSPQDDASFFTAYIAHTTPSVLGLEFRGGTLYSGGY